MRRKQVKRVLKPKISTSLEIDAIDNGYVVTRYPERMPVTGGLEKLYFATWAEVILFLQDEMLVSK
jgi:hypothetical protein